MSTLPLTKTHFMFLLSLSNHTLSYAVQVMLCLSPLSCSSGVGLTVAAKEKKVFIPQTNILYTPLANSIPSSSQITHRSITKIFRIKFYADIKAQHGQRQTHTPSPSLSYFNSMSLISVDTLFYRLKNHFMYCTLNLTHKHICYFCIFLDLDNVLCMYI